MLRILFDPLGDSHDDLVLKVDAMPGFAQIFDSYYLGDFLGYENETEGVDHRRNIAFAFIDHLQQRIASLNGVEQFIPIDLSDQYIGGLLLTAAKKDLLKVKYVTTKSKEGHAMDQNQAVGDSWREWKFVEQRQWLLSKQAVLDGLAWSKQQISDE